VHRPRYSIPKARFNEIKRVVLFEKMIHAREQQMLVFAAGSGFGKTTSLAHYARHHLNSGVFGAVAWVTLSEDENDPAAFIQSLICAINAAMPGGIDCQPLDDLPPRQRTAALAGQLNQLNHHVLLVLDGGHHLGASAQECLDILLRELAEGHQVCLSMYTSTTYPALTSMVARGTALLFEEQMLSFSRAETIECLALNDVSEFELDRLEGWPIAVGLMRAGLTVNLEPIQLIEHMLMRLPEDLCSTLEQMALYEFWSEIDTVALEFNAPKNWLLIAREAGLPISALGNGQFRPHALLTEVLLKKLQQQPEQFRSASRAAAIRAEHLGTKLSAMRHYRNAGCLPEAIHLADEITKRSQFQYELHFTKQVLEEFERASLPPVLVERLGSALYEIGFHQEGIELLSHLERQNQLPLAKISPLIDNFIRQGQTDLAKAMIESSLSQANDDLTWVEISLKQVSLFFNHAQYPEMYDLLLKILPKAEHVGDPLLLSACLGRLAVALLGQGRYQEAMIFLAREIDFSELHQVPLRSLNTRLNLVLTLLRQGRLEEALLQIERAALLAESGRHPRLADVMKVRAEVLCQMGDVIGAFLVVQSALQHSDAALFTTAQKIELWLKAYQYALDLGDLNWQDSANKHLNGLFFEIPLARFPHLEHLHTQLRTIEAKRLFAQVQTPQQQSTTKNAFIDALDSRGGIVNLEPLLFIADLERLENNKVSHETISTITEILTSFGGVQSLIQYKRHFPELFQMASQARWWLIPEPKQTSVIHQLEIKTFGGLTIHLNGLLVHMPFVRCAELLVWLALHGPATKDQMLDALWDGSADSAKAEYLRVILRQIRLTLTATQKLIANPIVYSKTFYALHPTLNIQLDYRQLKSITTQNDPDVLLAALNTHQGEFLPSMDSQWIQVARVEAQEIRLLAALRLGEQLESADADTAIIAYRKAIDLESFSELAYAGLTRIYQARKDQTGLASVIRLMRQNGLTD
jgi:LuxR family transcriptional regulator, maltose regulon positive regulatory protein